MPHQSLFVRNDNERKINYDWPKGKRERSKLIKRVLVKSA